MARRKTLFTVAHPHRTAEALYGQGLRLPRLRRVGVGKATLVSQPAGTSGKGEGEATAAAKAQPRRKNTRHQLRSVRTRVREGNAQAAP